MRKKLTIVGRGTAGCYAASHFAASTDLEIELYYDPNVKVLTVGESGNLLLPRALQKNLGINYQNIGDIDGTFKLGVTKLNWGDEGKPYINWFPSGQLSYHFYAHGLQNLILDKLQSRIKIVPERIDVSKLDSDFIMDCSGQPADYNDFHYLTEQDDSIPVNAGYVVECPWDFAKYNTTYAIARPYGWVFTVPLVNRLSVGYLYNRNINTLEEIKQDIEEVFKDLEVTPSEQTQTFNFNSYYRKRNFTDRICYNGNQSFFLEPLEATSVWAMNYVHNLAHGVWLNGKDVEMANDEYVQKLGQIETCIMLHYFAGSKFDTEFWRFAKERAHRHMSKTMKNPEFKYALQNILTKRKYELFEMNYGIWNLVIWLDHFNAWNIPRKLMKL
jgi:tryptophan halogenase